GGEGALPRVPAARVAPADRAARGPGAGQDRARRPAGRAAGDGARRAAGARVRPRGLARPGRWPARVLLVPPVAAEHVHGQACAGRPGPGAGGRAGARTEDASMKMVALGLSLMAV